jgi:hypothetical protein
MKGYKESMPIVTWQWLEMLQLLFQMLLKMIKKSFLG